jgi:hypothetical protein
MRKLNPGDKDRRYGFRRGGTGTVVYYESINGEVKRRLIHEYRCDERLKTKTETPS